MLYPDGSLVQAGDLIWWGEGHRVGFVQRVIETEAVLHPRWGKAPHITIGGFPYRPEVHGAFFCLESKFAADGIARLADDERESLNREIDQALSQSDFDPSATEIFVHSEERDGEHTDWRFMVRPWIELRIRLEESAPIRGPVK